ncbi:MAG: hypothetical protein JMJ93_09550 [Synergistaceae bacterium]|nr:hypothetical protein [Synergistaceae bacterium]
MKSLALRLFPQAWRRFQDYLAERHGGAVDPVRVRWPWRACSLFLPDSRGGGGREIFLPLKTIRLHRRERFQDGRSLAVTFRFAYWFAPGLGIPLFWDCRLRWRREDLDESASL